MAAETFIGKPCKYGHYGERYVNGSKACIECVKEYGSNRREKARKNKKHRAITIKRPGAPSGRKSRYAELEKPAQPTERESIEDFLARGGSINTADHGASGMRPETARYFIRNEWIGKDGDA